MTSREKIILSRPEMVLLAMFELSKKGGRRMKFEDIVVKTFQLYPEHFHLRGYPQYPDSGDTVHKPLYSTLKPKGLIQSGNKVFSITDRGLDVAKRLAKEVNGKTKLDESRLSRSSLSEIGRMKKTEGFLIFLKGEKTQIVETDLYSHLGANVRMNSPEFKGRLSAVESALEEAGKHESRDMMIKKLIDYHFFLMKKFRELIADFSKS